MAETGVNVKVLDSMPELLEIDEFYLNMFNACNTNFQNIETYCNLYGFDNEEIIEAVEIMSTILKGV